MEQYVLFSKNENGTAIFTGFDKDNNVVSVQDPFSLSQCFTKDQAKSYRAALGNKDIRVKSLAQSIRDYCTWSLMAIGTIKNVDEKVVTDLVASIKPVEAETATETVVEVVEEVKTETVGEGAKKSATETTDKKDKKNKSDKSKKVA